MEFTVRDWMMDLVVYIDPESTVSDALAVMRRRYIHSLIVSKSSKSPELGILTSTDICDKIVAPGRNPSQVTVAEIMTTPLIVVPETMPLTDCAAMMKTHHIHHLPVVNRAGEIVGLISATDFMVAAEAMGRAPGERII